MDHDQLNIQSLSARRIFERLRDEHGYNGGETGVKVAVRACKQHHREVFLPLSHPPGEAQIDFGFADVWLAGKLTKVALFVMTLPYSDVALMNENLHEGISTEFLADVYTHIQLTAGPKTASAAASEPINRSLTLLKLRIE